MSKSDNADVARIAILGVGLIGSGWAARCLAHGLDVVAWDPNPEAEQSLLANIKNAWPILEEVGLARGASMDRLHFTNHFEQAVMEADFIQENAPDNEALKRDLIARAGAASRSDVVIASSSSGIKPTPLQRGCQHPERVLIGHPFNPVYLLPLVEIMGGRQTDQHAIDRAGRFYRHIGMRPLHARVEIDGYISDRLQQALFHEALYMVRDGICTTAEIDAAITGGPGRRWAFMGPMLAFHLAGGEQGLRYAMQHWRPEEVNPWTHLPAPDFTPELIEAAVGGCEAIQGERNIKEFERRRDRCLLAIERALDEFWFSKNEDGWPEMRELEDAE